MSFFGSLFGGSNPTLNKDINAFGNIAGFASGQGQNDTSQASNFWSSILSGDQSKMSKALAPEISAAQGQAQQAKQQTAQFGNRSGGNNAAMQGIDDQTRAHITSLMGGLTTTAAGNLGSTGQNLMNTGLNAYGMQQQASQQQMENYMNSILGKGISGAINYGESFLPVAHGG